MANPVLTWVNTYTAGAGPAAASSFLTFSFAMTAGFEARVPVEFLMTNDFSFAPEIYVWRAAGGTYETTAEKTIMGVFRDDGLTTNRTLRKIITLDTGVYYIAVWTGSSSTTTYSAGLGTAEIITAYA